MVFVYTLLFFLCFFLFCGIGYIIQHKMIHGSCNGLAGIGIERTCSCKSPCLKRRVYTKLKRIHNKEETKPQVKA